MLLLLLLLLAAAACHTVSDPGFRTGLKAANGRCSPRLHSKDSRKIRASGIPVHIIHGAHDPLATPFFARRVQRRLRCNLTLTGAAGFRRLPAPFFAQNCQTTRYP